MTETTRDDWRLRALLDEAHLKSIVEGRLILASSVQPVPQLDSLALLETLATQSISSDTIATLFREGSAYWTRGSDEMNLAGLGAVATIESEGLGRFVGSDSAWSTIVRGAVVDDESNGAVAVGPTLMGGFAFEPDGPRTDPWTGFPSGHLIIPRILLTSADGRTWMTTSALIAPEADIEANVETLVSLRAAVISAVGSGEQETRPETVSSEIEFRDEPDAADWRSRVTETIDTIRSGSLEKVVLARAVHATAPNDIDVYATLRNLRKAHSNAFVFGYWRGASAFVGASPERLIQCDGQSVHASSLAGTARRGATAAEDARLVAELFASAKDRAEHEVVLRALKETLVEFCDDVTASSEPSVLTMPNMHHLETDVGGQIREGNSLLGIIARLHPTPAVGGNPRDAALLFIGKVEKLDRGWYAGPIGWIGRKGGEFAVALRSAIIYGPEAMLFAGCGIVADSDPDLELAESILKLQPMKSAISLAVATASSDSTNVFTADRG